MEKITSNNKKILDRYSDLQDEKFITISTPYYTAFMSIVNKYLENNYELICANCGILKKDDETNQIWQAILLRE